MRDRIKDSISIILAIIVIAISFRGCIQSNYNVEELKVYSLSEQLPETTKLYIVPSGYAIITKEYEEKYEYGVFSISGLSAGHYIGPLYNIGDNLLGIRVYLNADKVCGSAP